MTPLAEGIFNNFYMDVPLDRNALTIKVKWVYKNEFHIDIPQGDGKLTNVRAATFFEEYLPFVQQEILNRLLSSLK